MILFDVRGTGMSERNVDYVSAETLLADVEAVISAAQLDQFVIYSDFDLLAQHPALQLATAVPSRVTHLILESPFQNMSELAETPYGRVAAALLESDWACLSKRCFACCLVSMPRQPPSSTGMRRPQPAGPTPPSAASTCD